MKLLIICIIFFILYLFIYNFLNYFKIIEGLETCDKNKNDLTFKNTASIEQQQIQLKDFEEEIEQQLNTLKNKVIGFQSNISKNKKNIALNAKNLKSALSNIKNAAQSKQAQLNKAAGGL